MLKATQKRALYRLGLTKAEINKLDKAVTPSGAPQEIDLSSPAWTAALQRRTVFAKKARTAYDRTHKRKLTRQQFDRIVDTTFRGNIFDWLKLTYEPRKKTDFQEALKARLKRKESSLKRRFTR